MYIRDGFAISTAMSFSTFKANWRRKVTSRERA